jgi:hypothetical protein
MAHESEKESLKNKSNLARFFIEQRHVAWVSLALALVWGIYGLQKCRNARIRTSRYARR